MSIDFQRLEQVLAGAVERTDPAERAAFLDRECGTDQELRAEVERLVKANEQAGDFLENGEALTEPNLELVGATIGRYKILEQIGEGAFGVVYMAEQLEPVRRQLALKIIKAGMDSREVVARFEAERQALALMDHPNIAKVFDGGVVGVSDSQPSTLSPQLPVGRPYFVMELVRGIPITEFCDQRQLSTTERLRLFIQVCHAVQHAHQKGIIHRDLKPSNILVTLVDGEPVPKVIDFGVAKALGQKLTEKTLFTGFLKMVGTPAYMSPEQADLSGVDIDTRADIYALGVLLYELLTGVTPFDGETLRNAALDEIRRMIRETEPPKPSTRLQTLVAVDVTRLTSKADLDRASLRRLLQERKELINLVRGDLDWIVMKCLEKERGRRYETANNLAGDIERHLDHQPVLASPPGALYRMGKFVRRHRMGVALGASVAAALVLGLVAALVGFAQARRERDRALKAEQQAEAQAARSAQVAQFMKDMLKGVRPSVALGRDTTMLREILDQTVLRLDRDLTNRPGVKAELLSTIAVIYWELGDSAKAVEMQRQALALGASLPLATNAPAASSLSTDTLREEDLVQLEAMQREVIARQRKQLGNEHPALAASLWKLGLILSGRKPAEAEAAHREALAIRRRQFGNEHVDVVDSLNHWGMSLWDLLRPAEAEQAIREALSLGEKVLDQKHPALAMSCFMLSRVLNAQGKLDEAEKLARRALLLGQGVLGEAHPEVSSARNQLLDVLVKAGKQAEAETLIREALADQRKLLGNDHPAVARTLHKLADMCLGLGRPAEAEAVFREVVAMRRKLFGNEHVDLARDLHGLASALDQNGKPAEAEMLSREELAMRQKLLGPDHPDVAATLVNLVVFLREQGKLTELESLMRDESVKETSALQAFRQGLGHMLWQLGDARLARQQLTEAEREYAQSLTLFQQLEADYPTNTFYRQEQGFTLRNIAGVLERSGRIDEAEKTLRKALDLYRQIAKEQPTNTFYRQEQGFTLRNIAGVLERSGRIDEAERTLRKALNLYRQIAQEQPDSEFYRQEVARTLGELARLLRTQDAEQAVIETGRTNPMYLDTLAAAYAEAGQFTNALRVQKEAIALLNAAEQKKDYASRLKLYAGGIPCRAARAPANLIDLSLFYNAGLKENTTGDIPENNLAALPTGIQTLSSTQFDIRGLIQVSRSLTNYPGLVTNIPVAQSCQRLQFLHAAFNAGDVPDGRKIGRYSVHYSNGQQVDIAIVAGQDVADWWELSKEEGKPLAVAWTGANGKSQRTNHRIRLFKTTWPNPQPDVAVQSIDFEALDEQAVPFVVAITAE